jgi:hypothetical protein
LFFLSQCLDAFHGSPLSLQLDWLHFAGFFMYVYLTTMMQGIENTETVNLQVSGQ